MIHDNSLTTYISIAPELNRRQREVLDVYERENRPLTDEEVADIMGLRINHVTGRVGELLKKGKIFEVGKTHVFNRPRRLCEALRQTLF